MTHPDSFESWWNRSPWLDLKAEHSSEETKAIAKQTARSAWLDRGKLDAEICQSYAGTEMYPETLATYIRGLDE